MKFKQLEQKYTRGNVDPEPGDDTPFGDCWRTCVAILLDTDRDNVPHFSWVTRNDSETLAWWFATKAYVEGFMPGWSLRVCSPDFPIYNNPDNAPMIAIGSVNSPRGDWLHAVIIDAKTGDILWDPFPAALAEKMTEGVVHEVYCLGYPDDSGEADRTDA